jgi:hypothetical protein
MTQRRALAGPVRKMSTYLLLELRFFDTLCQDAHSNHNRKTQSLALEYDFTIVEFYLPFKM